MNQSMNFPKKGESSEEERTMPTWVDRLGIRLDYLGFSIPIDIPLMIISNAFM
jgi:hypothetical protein